MMVLLMSGWLLWPMLSEAQGPGLSTFDLGNYWQNLATAISTAESVKQQVKDLSDLADFTEYTTTLQTVLAFAGAASQLSSRLLGRYSRWVAIIPGVAETIPCTVEMLGAWSRVYDRDSQESLWDAGVAQTLVANAETTLHSVMNVMNLARGITGTTSGLQNLHTLMAQLVGLVGGAQAMRAPMDESVARKEMRGVVHAQAVAIMKENRLAGLEGRERQTCLAVAGL